MCLPNYPVVPNMKDSLITEYIKSSDIFSSSFISMTILFNLFIPLFLEMYHYSSQSLGLGWCWDEWVKNDAMHSSILPI